MKNLLIIKIAVIAVLVAIISGGLPAETAQAHTLCKIPLPAGGWMEGCPHLDVPEEPSSCLATFTDTKYEFRINNKTGHTVVYLINGKRYSLSNGYGRDHKYQKAYGTNSCNIRSYNKPVIKFDYSYKDGTQLRSYTVGDYRQETFLRTRYGKDLFH